MSFWSQCHHMREVSPADDEGTAICLECGEAVRNAVLTRAGFERVCEDVKRLGYHSRWCVESDEGWCCAPNCPSLRP